MIERATMMDVSYMEIISCLASTKKQNCISLSTVEDKYIDAGSNCTQLKWMTQMLKEYNMTQDVMKLYCDNMSAINISKNPIQHICTKHIVIKYHFILEFVEEKVISLDHVTTDKQLASIFTKSIDAIQFETPRTPLRLCVMEL